MLYTKPIEQIEWSDIEQFCQQKTKEGAYLDYKREFPAQLEKTIAAMANTLGGVILIGVAEDSESTPVLPLVGIPFERGLEERITGIILSNMVPPVFPEMQIVRDESGEKAAIVVRIPQSNQTPHAIARNTKVYLRTGNVNNPEELATIDEIEWLRDKRSKSEGLREHLHRRASERFDTLLSRNVRASPRGLADILEAEGRLTLCASPRYPQQRFNSPPQMPDVYAAIRQPDWYGALNSFPPAHPPGLGQVVEDALLFTNYWDEKGQFFYTELNCFGQLFYRQNLQVQQVSEDWDQPIEFRASELLIRIDQFREAAFNFYKLIGCWGLVDLRIDLTRILNCSMKLDWPPRNAEPAPGLCPDPEVHFSETILVAALESDRENLVLQALEQILWAFGWSRDRDDLSDYYRACREWYVPRTR